MEEKKVKKVVIIMILFLISSLGLGSIASANDNIIDPLDDEESEVYILEGDKLVEDPLFSEVSDSDMGTQSIIRGIKYTKENVKTTNEWSSYRRVSDNIWGPGSITADRSVTFGTQASGSYANLGFSLNTSVSSKVGYTLNAGKKSRVYMGYRVRYKVERGERVGRLGSREISRQSYTVKTPMYGEYKLINYK